MSSKPTFSLQAGGFLVSEPYLQDPQFFRSVLVLVEHNEQGTIGFVVNKPLSDVLLSELIDVPEGMELTVFLGGPVQQDTIFFLHNLGLGLLPKSIEVTSDLWWSSDFSRLFELIEQGIRSTHAYDVFQLRAMLAVPYFEKKLYELPESEVTPENILKCLCSTISL